MDWSNFINADKHLSYSFQNPYPASTAPPQNLRWAGTVHPRLAIAADKNPGMSSGSSVSIVVKTSPAKQMKISNSQNHERVGQNVLYVDGHVSFEQTPFVGPPRDNIYTTKSRSNALTGGPIVASPVDGNDCILLPTKK